MGIRLNYRGPGGSADDLRAGPPRTSALAVVSLVLAGFNVVVLFVAWQAALDVWRVPGFYMNWIVFGLVELLLYGGAGLGCLFAVGALMRKDRRRAAAVWALAVNGLLLLAILLLRLLVVNPMRGF